MSKDNELGDAFAYDTGLPLTSEPLDRMVPRYKTDGIDMDKIMTGLVRDGTIGCHVFTKAEMEEGPDQSVIMIREDHPHHALITKIMSMTGLAEFLRGSGAKHPALLAENLPFEIALTALKMGYRVARAGWNGKGMWICLGEGRSVPPSGFWNKHSQQFAMDKYMANSENDSDLTRDERLTEILPYTIMKTADDKILMGWLCSQSDLYATDWAILED